jgi:ATP-dependent DNA ligase
MTARNLSNPDAAKIKFIEPMYARPVQFPPERKEWFYEVKFDGYRCLAGRDQNVVTLWSRRGNLFTAQFPRTAQACESLPAGTLLDGEVVAIDASGRISFNLLQHHRSQAQAILFYAFDVLIHRGRSLLAEPLERRREVLSEIFKSKKGGPSALALSDIMDATLAELVRVAREFGFEGIVAKRKDSLYESGKRTGAWVKYRINRGQQFIGRYVPADLSAVMDRDAA